MNLLFRRLLALLALTCLLSGMSVAQSVTILKYVNFGAAKTGLPVNGATNSVGYQLQDNAGTSVGSRVTTGTFALGGGGYAASVTYNPATAAFIRWDTGEATPTYAPDTLSGAGFVTVGGYLSGQSPADLVLATAANKLATDSNGYIRLQATTHIGAVIPNVSNAIVGSYASGQDPATLVLATPANKLATNGSGAVTSTQAYPSFFSSLQISAGGKVASTISTGDNGDKNGYSLATSQSFSTTGNVGGVSGDVTGKVVGSGSTAFVGNGAQVAAGGSTVMVGGYSSGQEPETRVLGATASAYLASGTIGRKINDAGSASDPLGNATSGYSAGTGGAALNKINLGLDSSGRTLLQPTTHTGAVIPTVSTVSNNVNLAQAFPTNFSQLLINSSGLVQLDLAQSLPSSTGDNIGTALRGALTQTGKWVVDGTPGVAGSGTGGANPTLKLYSPAGTLITTLSLLTPNQRL